MWHKIFVSHIDVQDCEMLHILNNKFDSDSVT